MRLHRFCRRFVIVHKFTIDQNTAFSGPLFKLSINNGMTDSHTLSTNNMTINTKDTMTYTSYVIGIRNSLVLSMCYAAVEACSKLKMVSMET